jgi:hypothetical protein
MKTMLRWIVALLGFLQRLFTDAFSQKSAEHILEIVPSRTREIPLTQGQVALVDEDDFERVNAFKWQAVWEKRTKSFYAVHVTNRPNRTTIQLSRFIMQTPKDLMCDHINHDTLDNRKCNLRTVTVSQNSMNRRSGNTKTKIKCIELVRNRYRVHIRINDKTAYRKSFDTLEDAIIARDVALKKFHGDFAYLD